MTEIIILLNNKGGVGKSTTATHLAAGLAIRGYNVGVVDMDPQGHQSVLLGLDIPEVPRRDLYKFIIQNAPLSEVVQVIDLDRIIDLSVYPAEGNIYLISGDDSTAMIPGQMGPSTALDFLGRLDEFAEIGNLDYIIMDSAPTISTIDNLTYLAATGFLFVVEPEVLALNGLQQALQKFHHVKPSKEKQLRRESKLLGIIPLKVRTSTYLHRNNIAAMAEQYGGDVWTPIGINVTWGYAAQAGQTVFKFAPNEGAANEALRYTDRVLKKLEAVGVF